MPCKTLKKTLTTNLLRVDNLPLDIVFGQTYSISQPNPNYLTHGFFKYPCKFIPEIPRWAIKKYLNYDGILFDPFAGSGTSLLEGILHNKTSYGTEIDSIAKLITKVKTTKLSINQLKTAQKIFENIIEKAQYSNIPPTQPKINNLTHWFNEKNLYQLGKIKTLINDINDLDIKDFFNLCFVSIIKKVSNADDISPKPYVSTKIKKIPPETLDEFIQTFKKYYNFLEEFSNMNILQKAILTTGNALDIQFDKKIDLAITSPPYINAFDYARTLRLENLWMDFLTEEELLNKKGQYVGTEKFYIANEENNLNILNDSEKLQQYYESILPIDKKRALIIKKFFDDMKTNLTEIYNALNKEGHYIIVIGDSNIRNIQIESWKVINDIANKLNFKTELYFDYIIQNPYIRIPRNQKGGKINKDNVLVLKK